MQLSSRCRQAATLTTAYYWVLLSTKRAATPLPLRSSQHRFGGALMPKRTRTQRQRRHAHQQQSVACYSTKKKNSDAAVSQQPLFLSQTIIKELHDKSDSKTKEWFTNYVKGTVWIGCKMPVVRKAIQSTLKKTNDANVKHDNDVIVDNAIYLLQQQECDVKLAGMLLLSEHILPQQQQSQQLATSTTCHQTLLDRLEQEVLAQGHVSDWSTADWLANKVLSKIVFANNNEELVQRVLDYTTVVENHNNNGSNLIWYRRCGVVPFLRYTKHRSKLPADFGSRLIQACENCLLAATLEERRFAQTGIAWVLRYVLLEPQEQEEALAMILRHEHKWTTEAKKSLTEKMSKSDPRRTKILSLGSSS